MSLDTPPSSTPQQQVRKGVWFTTPWKEPNLIVPGYKVNVLSQYLRPFNSLITEGFKHITKWEQEILGSTYIWVSIFLAIVLLTHFFLFQMSSFFLFNIYEVQTSKFVHNFYNGSSMILLLFYIDIMTFLLKPNLTEVCVKSIKA